MADPYKRDRRLGRWFVSGAEMAEYPGRLQEIQDHVLILRAVPAFMNDACEFMGRSPEFDIVPEGDEVPLYRPVMLPVIAGGGMKWERVDG